MEVKNRDTGRMRGNLILLWQKKEDLPLRFEDALSLADDDIDDNWEIYADLFLRGDFS